MDTYIKMCKKAREYLPEWDYKDGDLYSTVFNDGVFLVYRLDAWADVPHYKKHPAECFPVYRQDQLQEMVDEVSNKKHFIFRFCEFLKGSYLPVTHMNAFVWFANSPEDIISMEQLWLAFVMKEKYNKVWNGEEWV